MNYACLEIRCWSACFRSLDLNIWFNQCTQVSIHRFTLVVPELYFIIWSVLWMDEGGHGCLPLHMHLKRVGLSIFCQIQCMFPWTSQLLLKKHYCLWLSSKMRQFTSYDYITYSLFCFARSYGKSSPMLLVFFPSFSCSLQVCFYLDSGSAAVRWRDIYMWFISGWWEISTWFSLFCSD